MGSQGADTLVNRDDPIPVVSVTSHPDETPSPARSERPHSKREALKQSAPAAKLREKLEELDSNRSGSPGGVQDRLLNVLLQQVIPSEDVEADAGPVDKRSRKYVDRPNFSLPIMSYNFRRFNARVGVVFVFQNRLIRLFSWKKPTHTLSFLAIYTFICLDPSLLAVLPVTLCLFFVMIPAFLARHPPPPSGNLPTEYYTLQGPPLAPPQSIKPAPDLSKDFFRNMRDLQNSMEDFSRMHDSLIAWLAPPTNFSNEALSSALFLFFFALACVLFISAHLLPWRLIFLCGGWGAICAGHPSFQSFLHTTHTDELLEKQDVAARSRLISFAATDIDLSSAPETREVEIFELQRRAGGRPGLHISDMDFEYEPFMFSPEAYTPLSPARIMGQRPKGTRFFEDVRPPKGWRWADKKWTLDLLSREWVEERCITGVEVEVEGERWVSDIKYKEESGGGDVEEGARAADVKRRGKEKVVTWEEGNGNGARKGEWRRRRWVRLVERKPMTANEG